MTNIIYIVERFIVLVVCIFVYDVIVEEDKKVLNNFSLYRHLPMATRGIE